ncbi:Persistence and stress-resistance toxin PasT [Candidatus Profftia lariciata]|uniref:SRPBCC family protein n=1 Tax=Candidatus Profftia lariciata TaxID=1987921 RepID=UPI001D02F28B|nr:SRPBCC family protein [Candidatus Profftia lariciata]UDG81567.1 Persistence and stress-resistance toxin PasT [Candidatus Profftia lariciata]
MTQISCSSLLPFNATQMYQLINDVTAYPTFLPGCIGSRILEFSQNYMIASIDIYKAGIKKTLITRNTLADNSSITMQLIYGPLSKLLGYWYFIPLSDDTCKVNLYLDFEVNDKLMQFALQNILKKMVKQIIHIFTVRAQEIYGNSCKITNNLKTTSCLT